MNTLDPGFTDKFSFELQSSSLLDLLASDRRHGMAFLLFDHHDFGDDDYMGEVVVPAAYLVEGVGCTVPKGYNVQSHTQIKSLTRYLVSSGMQPGTSAGFLDYSQYGDDFPEVLTWSVQWFNGKAGATAWLFDVDQGPTGSVSANTASMGGV